MFRCTDACMHLATHAAHVSHASCVLRVYILLEHGRRRLKSPLISYSSRRTPRVREGGMGRGERIRGRHPRYPGRFKGSATKGPFQPCSLTFVFQIMTKKNNNARVCNKALESPKTPFSNRPFYHGPFISCRESGCRDVLAGARGTRSGASGPQSSTSKCPTK